MRRPATPLRRATKYALEIDDEMDPPMFKISDTHYAATWLLDPTEGDFRKSRSQGGHAA